MFHVYALIAREHGDIREQGLESVTSCNLVRGRETKSLGVVKVEEISRGKCTGGAFCEYHYTRAQKPLHESGDTALYAKNQSAAIRRRTEVEYLWCCSRNELFALP